MLISGPSLFRRDLAPPSCLPLSSVIGPSLPTPEILPQFCFQPFQNTIIPQSCCCYFLPDWLLSCFLTFGFAKSVLLPTDNKQLLIFIVTTPSRTLENKFPKSKFCILTLFLNEKKHLSLAPSLIEWVMNFKLSNRTWNSLGWRYQYILYYMYLLITHQYQRLERNGEK